MTDQELVRATLQNANAYAELVEKYEGKLLHYVQRFLYVGKEDAEDIVQETFINAYRYLLSYKQDLSFSTWLYRIAHNQCVSYLRRHKSRIAAEYIQVDNEDDTDNKDLFVSDENLEENVLKILTQESIMSKLSMLESTSREVLVLRYLEEKEYSDIADILKVPEGTVASLIHRAKIKLKTLLSNEQTQ